MAKMQRLEADIELKCAAKNLFNMLRTQQPDVAAVCSQISGVEPHQGDWLGVGSTRKWDCVIGGKPLSLIDRIEEIDEKNMKLSRAGIGGDLMSHYSYKTMTVRVHLISKGKDCCLMKFTIEYEKIDESAPEPTEVLNFAIGLFKELASHLSSLN